jgi:hypothetical protein
MANTQSAMAMSQAPTHGSRAAALVESEIMRLRAFFEAA